MLPKRFYLLFEQSIVILFSSTKPERGGSAVECWILNREPGFESPLLPFRSLGIFVYSTVPQLTQLYKWVPGYRQQLKCDWIVLLRGWNASQRGQVHAGMNRSARGWSVKRFERSSGLDNAIYMSKPLPFYFISGCLLLLCSYKTSLAMS